MQPIVNFTKQASVAALLFAGTAVISSAQSFSTLFSFDGKNGSLPEAGLVQSWNGDLYGTTYQGGGESFGTVFKITPTGTLTSLYSFCSLADCADGEYPTAALIQATNGDLYGTTYGNGYPSRGTVFKISPSGTLATLYSFCAQGGCPDGTQPWGGLVQGVDGNFYGTTASGGAQFKGTVFKITPGGVLTTLYSFCAQSGCSDGWSPEAGLIQATDGDFYGTTAYGGAQNYGTIFKITPSGTLTTLYTFCAQSGCSDGADPMAALVLGTNGDFYGTTYSGGAQNYGTVFKITPTGTLTTLYSFCTKSGCADGAHPIAGLVRATGGNLYGTTADGGNQNCGNFDGCGTIFGITPSGTLTTLHIFCTQSNCTDGDYVRSGLVQDTNGDFYGTTGFGGSYDAGTVFRLSLGLDPFVKLDPNFGMVGAAVEILGTDLADASSVTFNGTAARFTVVSASLITATVPTGATTGPILVTTSSGTLLSSVAYRVVQ